MDKEFSMPVAVFVAAVMCAFIAALITFISVKKNKSADVHYDERQLTIRAKGYQIGFLVTVVAMFVVMLLIDDYIGLGAVIEPSLAVLIGVMIGLVTFAVYCIQKEVFFGIGERPIGYIILVCAVVISNLVIGIIHIAEGTLMENGQVQFEKGSSLVIGISFLVIGIALLIKQAGRKGGEEE